MQKYSCLRRYSASEKILTAITCLATSRRPLIDTLYLTKNVTPVLSSHERQLTIFDLQEIKDVNCAIHVGMISTITLAAV